MLIQINDDNLRAAKKAHAEVQALQHRSNTVAYWSAVDRLEEANVNILEDVYSALPSLPGEPAPKRRNTKKRGS